MPGTVSIPWPSTERVVEIARGAKSQVHLAELIADEVGCYVSRGALQSFMRREGIEGAVRESLQRASRAPTPASPIGALDQQLQEKLAKEKDGKPVSELADDLDVSPKRVREALGRLRDNGFRIPEESDEDPHIKLHKVAPARQNLHRSLLDGDEVTIGLVSDTHLCSKEFAGEALDLAYDVFEERGIKEVWHSGDLVAGRGIYRTQDQDLTHFTYKDQVDFAIERYPKREGITTRLIAGNHDIEGDFGRLGANPVVAVCNQREDMEYLGDYSAHIELPNGAFAQLVHGRGGGSYAMSYKAQKWLEGLPPGRKPALVCFGHWHVSGLFRHRHVTCVLGGCFEWQTSLLVRLGLQPDVGWWILTLRLGEDGSLVGIAPEFVPIYEGRAAE